jgi:hypothetical protein
MRPMPHVAILTVTIALLAAGHGHPRLTGCEGTLRLPQSAEAQAQQAAAQTLQQQLRQLEASLGHSIKQPRVVYVCSG